MIHIFLTFAMCVLDDNLICLMGFGVACLVECNQRFFFLGGGGSETNQ